MMPLQHGDIIKISLFVQRYTDDAKKIFKSLEVLLKCEFIKYIDDDHVMVEILDVINCKDNVGAFNCKIGEIRIFHIRYVSLFDELEWINNYLKNY